jgi:hypothetical protein
VDFAHSHKTIFPEAPTNFQRRLPIKDIGQNHTSNKGGRLLFSKKDKHPKFRDSQ